MRRLVLGGGVAVRVRRADAQLLGGAAQPAIGVDAQGDRADIERADGEQRAPRVGGKESGQRPHREQVFINLLSNAVKFTPSHGNVTVHAHRTADGGVVVVITDSGIGMTDADIDLAMTVFGQVDNDLARRYSGTGLGLPLAKAIVELHRGTIEIESYPGRGTTVTVALPRERVWEGEPPDAIATKLPIAATGT